MPTPIQLPESADGWYDRTHGWQQPPSWQNANDRVSYERAFVQDPVEQGKIQQALVTADPATPDVVIQKNMTAGPAMPVAPREPLTVMQCFSRDVGHAGDCAPANFSGRLSEINGSSIPSLPPF